MLTQITIRDLATIEALELNFSHGCTMITGETGAGKSIFIEAIELALGGRASPHMIRPGKDKAEISLCFNIEKFSHVVTRLKECDLDLNHDELIIRRIMTSDGRSRCTLNHSPVTLQLVKEFGELLFHLHSQHEQHILLKIEAQREMLDRFADHLPLVNQVQHLSNDWKSISQEIQKIEANRQKSLENSDYLRFQLTELQQLNLQAGEWENIEAEHRKLSHCEEITQHIQHSLSILSNDEENILSSLHDIKKVFEGLVALELKAQGWNEVIQSASIQINDLVSELNKYLENTDLDPIHFQSLSERLSKAFDLARKYKVAPEALHAMEKRITQELSGLDSHDEMRTELINKRNNIENQYRQLTDELSKNRKKAARELEKKITTLIRSLSLPHGEFRILLEKNENSGNEQKFSSCGNEKILFLIKTNPDQTPQPLTKILSGGELSRLSLAVHLALAKHTTIPTLVFDEVDTGLSGATAERIGKLLRTLGDSYQVFCVTHQAQVAACGHHHLLVEKYFKDEITYTRLRTLTPKEKELEIARLLGGEKITKKTLEHAKEILALG